MFWVYLGVIWCKIILNNTYQCVSKNKFGLNLFPEYSKLSLLCKYSWILSCFDFLIILVQWWVFLPGDIIIESLISVFSWRLICSEFQFCDHVSWLMSWFLSMTVAVRTLCLISLFLCWFLFVPLSEILLSVSIYVSTSALLVISCYFLLWKILCLDYLHQPLVPHSVSNPQLVMCI